MSHPPLFPLSPFFLPAVSGQKRLSIVSRAHTHLASLAIGLLWTTMTTS